MKTKTEDPDTPLLIALLGGLLMTSFLGVPQPQNLDEMTMLMSGAIQTIRELPRGKTEKEMVLAFTYGLLQNNTLSWKAAAVMASALSHEYYSDEAWRKKVKRWAKDRTRENLEPLNLRKGRPPKIQS